MDKNIFIRKSALRPTEEQRLLTQPFYQNANTFYKHFHDWKDIDRFYFIPLYLEMTYCVAGIVSELAPDPVWLGSFVQNTLNHPELYQYRCPKCGMTVLPFSYVGSPLSGRVDLEGYCDCRWKGFKTVSGWHLRANVLRDIITADTPRFRKFKRNHPDNEQATIDDLLDSMKQL
jgi:hypothetical protein